MIKEEEDAIKYPNHKRIVPGKYCTIIKIPIYFRDCQKFTWEVVEDNFNVTEDEEAASSTEDFDLQSNQDFEEILSDDFPDHLKNSPDMD